MEPFVLFAIAGAVAPIDSATANATALLLIWYMYVFPG